MALLFVFAMDAASIMRRCCYMTRDEWRMFKAQDQVIGLMDYITDLLDRPEYHNIIGSDYDDLDETYKYLWKTSYWLTRRINEYERKGQ